MDLLQPQKNYDALESRAEISIGINGLPIEGDVPTTNK